jgi:hypothetical protein
MSDPDCDANYPVVYQIDPRSKISMKFLVGILCKPISDPSYDEGRLGFVLIRENEIPDDILFFKNELMRRKDAKSNIVWSDEIICNS